MPNGKREQPTHEDRLTPRVPSVFYLVNHRCHRHQGGGGTTTLSTAQDMLTARRPSLLASWYSSSVATRTATPPLSVVRGPETARNPVRREPSSANNSTRWPGSGTSGGLFPPKVIHTYRVRGVPSRTILTPGGPFPSPRETWLYLP